MIRLATTLLLTATLAVTATASQKVYTWKDEKGVTHFGERPPKGAEVHRVKTYRTPSSTAPSATPAQSTATAPAIATQALPQDEDSIAIPTYDADRCQAAQRNLNALQSGMIIRVQDDDGVQVILTEDEKAKKREDMEKVVAESC